MGQVARATPRPPKASANKAASDGDDSGGEHEGAEEAGSPFCVLLRGREQPDSTALLFEKATPEKALCCALEHDVSGITEPLLTWGGLKQAVALDYDREGNIPVDSEEVDRFFPEGLPRPLAAWVTHGGWLRVIFVETEGVPPLELAGTWALLSPLKHVVGWRLEVKSDSRHPKGLRGEARCGRIHWFAPSTNLVVPGNRILSIASEADIQQWLEAHGLTFGRHPTERCIWCGSKPASGSPAFVVEEWGVRCFRCEGRTSWDELLGIVVLEDLPSLYQAAGALVHYPHQRHVLHGHRPSVPEMLLRPAWKRMLREVHRDRLEDKAWAKRVDRAVSDHVDVVRGASGAWLDAKTLEPRLVTPSRTLAEMPWCHSGTMIDAAANAGPLRGFVAIQPRGADELIGPFVEPPAGSIFVARSAARGAPPPIPLGEKAPDPAVVEQAWHELEQLLPGLHRGYSSGLIAARFYAQRGIGLPPIAVVTGISGVGKTATQHLVAAATGTQASIVRLEDPPETLRQIGLALEHGSGLVFVDEVGRVPDLYRRLDPILALNSTVTYAPKFINERTAAMTAAISLLGSAMPMAIIRSPELSRRAVGWRLRQKTSNWSAEFGDLGRARAHEVLRRHLDVVTSDIWWKVHALGLGGNWQALCLREFGATRLTGLDLVDAEGAGQAAGIRLLYEYFRNAPDTEFTNGAVYAGWLKANANTTAGDILGDLVNFDGDRRQTKAESSELQRLELGPILGFSTPSLRLFVTRRSGNWLVKFVIEGVMKGRGCKRKDLPPVNEPETPGMAETAEAGVSTDTEEREEVVL